MFVGEVSVKQALQFVYISLKPFPMAVIAMLAVAIVWAVDLSLMPYILKVILDGVAEYSSQTSEIKLSIFELLRWPVIIYFMLAFLTATIFRKYSYFVEIKMIPELRQKIANNVFGRAIQHSHSYYQNNFSGSLANKINDLTSSVPDIIQIIMDRFFSHTLALLIAIYALWQVNIKFAVVMILWAGLCVTMSLYYSKKLRLLADNWSHLGSAITGQIVDVLSNVLSVRLFSGQKQEQNNLDITLKKAVLAEQKLQWNYFWVWVVFGYSFVILQIACICFLLFGVQDGSITVGDFALIITINIAVGDFLWQLAKDFSQFYRLLGKITQALTITTTPIEVLDQANAKELLLVNSDIVFDKVKFHYKGTNPLFDNKSITIKSGQKVGLVGYSGSGKTTFVNLILRLFDINSGRILIDSQDIKEVTQASLRNSIAMIPQDPSLFNRSLMDNIRYSRIDASDEEVIIAAKQAYAHEFIIRLPEAYNSMVGERGIKISGGQRQRIAIARAILKNAPILILDEATSQLDSITEGQIQASLWELMQNKTTMVIAHRLSTLLHMDRILVFHRGKIVEDGQHIDLLSNPNGIYKKLWEAQIGGFLPDK